MSKMHIILVVFLVNTIVSAEDSSKETKYIDLLPEKEKEAFLDRVARRILNGVQVNVSNDELSGEKVPESQLDENDKFVKNILKEETMNNRRNEQSDNQNVKNDTQAQIDPRSLDKKVEIVDLTLRAGKREKRNSLQKSNKDSKIVRLTVGENIIGNNTIKTSKTYESDGEDIQIKFFKRNNLENSNELEVTTRGELRQTQMFDFDTEEVNQNSNKTESVTDESKQELSNKTETVTEISKQESTVTIEAVTDVSKEESLNKTKNIVQSQENNDNESDNDLGITQKIYESIDFNHDTDSNESIKNETVIDTLTTLIDKSSTINPLDKISENILKVNETEEEINKSNQIKSNISLHRSYYIRNINDVEQLVTKNKENDKLINEVLVEKTVLSNTSQENNKFINIVKDENNTSTKELNVTQKPILNNIREAQTAELSTKHVSSTNFFFFTTTKKMQVKEIRNVIRTAKTIDKQENNDDKDNVKIEIETSKDKDSKTIDRKNETKKVIKEINKKSKSNKEITTNISDVSKTSKLENSYTEKTTNSVLLLRVNKETIQKTKDLPSKGVNIETTTLKTEALTQSSVDLKENSDSELDHAKVVVLQTFIKKNVEKKKETQNHKSLIFQEKESHDGNKNKISYNLANDMIRVLKSRVSEQNPQKNNGLLSPYDTSKPKEYTVYEVPSEQLKLKRHDPNLRNRDKPYYVPIYIYSPDNAYYDPRNRFEPSSYDDDKEMIIEKDRNGEYSDDRVSDNNIGKLNTVLRSVINDRDKEILRLFRQFFNYKKENKRKFRFGAVEKKSKKVGRYKINMPVVIQYPKYTDIILSPNDYLDMDYYYGRAFRNGKSKEVSEEGSKKVFKEESEEEEEEESKVSKDASKEVSKEGSKLESKGGSKDISSKEESTKVSKELEAKEVTENKIASVTKDKYESVENANTKIKETEISNEQENPTEKNKKEESEENYVSEEKPKQKKVLPKKTEQSKIKVTDKNKESKEKMLDKTGFKEKKKTELEVESEYEIASDNILKDIKNYNNHVRLIRQHLYKNKHFGFVPPRHKPYPKYTDYEKNARNYFRINNANSDKPKNLKNIAIDYFFGRMSDKLDTKTTHLIKNEETKPNKDNRKPSKNKYHFHYQIENIKPKRGTPLFAYALINHANKNDTLRANKNRSHFNAIKEILKFTPERHLQDAIGKLLEIYPQNEKTQTKIRSRSKVDLEPYLLILQDMVENNGEALNQYDWLGTTVDVQAALLKLMDLTFKLQTNFDINIPDPDLQLFKYAIYLHKTAKSQKDFERSKMLPRNKKKKMGVIKTSGLLNRVWLYRKLVEISQYDKIVTDDDMNEFSEFLSDLQFFLYDLHTAVKQIANITKYKSQNWFRNLKELYLDTNRHKLLEILLHITCTRLLDLVEEGTKRGLKDDFLTYAENNEKLVDRGVNELDLALEIIKELKSYR